MPEVDVSEESDESGDDAADENRVKPKPVATPRQSLNKMEKLEPLAKPVIEKILIDDGNVAENHVESSEPVKPTNQQRLSLAPVTRSRMYQMIKLI